MRAEGRTFKEIGARFDTSKQYGAQLVREDLAEIHKSDNKRAA